MKWTVFLVVTFFSLFLISCARKDQLDQYHGDWIGILDLGESRFNLALQVNSKDQYASFYIVDAKAEFVKVDTMHVEDDSLQITISEIYGAYKCVNYKNKLSGKWKLANDQWVDMTFERADFNNLTGFHPRVDRNYRYQEPLSKGDQWVTSKLEEESISSIRIINLVQDIINEKYKNIHSLLIVKNSKLVLEEYFYGYTGNNLNNIQSVSKSFWSALLGIAIEQGAIKDVTQSICPYFKEYGDLNCQHQNINIYHLLTMTAGWKWDETSISYDNPENSSDQMMASEDPLLFTLTRPKAAIPGERF